jgi:integrator complex subunit 7
MTSQTPTRQLSHTLSFGKQIAHLLHDSSSPWRFEHSLWPAFRVRGDHATISSSSNVLDDGAAVAAERPLSRDLPQLYRDIETRLRSPIAGASCEAVLFLPPLIAACYDAQVLASNDAALIAAASLGSSASASTPADAPSFAVSALVGAVTANQSGAHSGAVGAVVAPPATLTAPAKRRRLVADERVGNAALQATNHRVTVDSCFLLAGELFRNGSNVNRHLLLHVFNVCEPYLAFVVSADELVNRVASVVASNDPIAQSLSLDALACLRPLIAARADVRHRVLACVGAVDHSVRAAALRAVERLARSAARFGDEAAPVLIGLVVDAAVDAHARAHAAEILRLMHRCDARSTYNARVALRRVLDEAGVDDSLRGTALVSLSVLSERTLVEVPQQLQCNVDIALARSCSAALRRVAARCSRRLAARAVALLDSAGCEQLAGNLLAVARSSARPSVPIGVLRCAVTGSPAGVWSAATLAAVVQICDSVLSTSMSLVCCAHAASALWHLERSGVPGGGARSLALACSQALARCPLPSQRSMALICLLRIVVADPGTSAQPLAALVDLLERQGAKSLALSRLLLRSIAHLACVKPDEALAQCGARLLGVLQASWQTPAICSAAVDALCSVLRRASVATSATWQAEASKAVRSASADASALYGVLRASARCGQYALASDVAALLQASAGAQALSHSTSAWLLSVVAPVVAAERDLFAAAQACCGAAAPAERAAADSALGRALRHTQRQLEEALAVVEQLATSALTNKFSFQRQWLALRVRCCSLLSAVVACMAASDSPRSTGVMLACRFAAQLADLAAECDGVLAAVLGSDARGAFASVASDDGASLQWYATSIRLFSQLCAAGSASDAANQTRLAAVAVRMQAHLSASATAASGGELVPWPPLAPLRSQQWCAQTLASLDAATCANTAPRIREFFVSVLGATALATPARFFVRFR